eukprot:1159014-Pelagomonas_calceolata.AAC.4
MLSHTEGEEVGLHSAGDMAGTDQVGARMFTRVGSFAGLTKLDPKRLTEFEIRQSIQTHVCSRRGTGRGVATAPQPPLPAFPPFPPFAQDV